MGFLDKMQAFTATALDKVRKNDENVSKPESDDDPDAGLTMSNVPTIAHASANSIGENLANTGNFSPNQTANSEKQEIHDGHIFVDGVDLGEVDISTMRASGRNDVLNLLNIPANYPIDDSVLLPGDLTNIKFSEEDAGFSKEEVANFYDAVVESIDYYVKLLNKRNEDVARLADNAISLQETIHNKEIEAEIQQNSGLSVITGSNNIADMNAQMKIRQLQAENAELRKRSNEQGSASDYQELQRRYDDLQNAFSSSQYDIRQLQEQLAQYRSSEHAQDNSLDGNDFINQQIMASAQSSQQAQIRQMQAQNQPMPTQQTNMQGTQQTQQIQQTQPRQMVQPQAQAQNARNNGRPASLKRRSLPRKTA